jgi:hypothetical protein
MDSTIHYFEMNWQVLMRAIYHKFITKTPNNSIVYGTSILKHQNIKKKIAQ